MTVDLPTPPLPEPIATTCFTPGGSSRLGAVPRGAAACGAAGPETIGWRGPSAAFGASGFTTQCTATSVTPGTAFTAALIGASRAPCSPWAPGLMSTEKVTMPCIAFTSRIMPSETRS